MTRRYQFLGYIIEQTALGFWVLDWDYETETPIGPVHKSRYAAENWILSRELAS